MRTGNVIITDASSKNGLAAIRALGRKGLKIIAVTASRICPGHFSKYVSKTYHHQRVTNDPISEFTYYQFLRKVAEKENIDVIIPISIYSSKTIVRFQDQLQQIVNIAVPSHASFQIAAEKEKTIQAAEQVAINVPQTLTIFSHQPIEKQLDAQSLKYPIVLKSNIEGGSVCYAHTPESLIFQAKAKFQTNSAPLLVQEYIHGKGAGFFALMSHGKLIQGFMHQREREYPPTGGPSVEASSMSHKAIFKAGIRLLKALEWHGVAMVEFKLVQGQKPVLMEINPKFWGSLDLAIKAGVNFPWLLYKLAMGYQITPKKEYNRIRVRWLFPQSLQLFFFGKHRLRNLYEMFPLRNNLQFDLDLLDPIPNLIQLLLTPLSLIKEQKRLKGESKKAR